MESRKGLLNGFPSLAVLLICDLALALVVARSLPFTDPLPEYSFPASEFAQIHRISSTFLPIGYSALLGLGQVILGGQAGWSAVNITIYLLWVVFVWLLLKKLGATGKQALIAAAVFSVYPDILLGVNKVMETTLTSLLLLAFMTSVIYLVRHSDSYKADILLALSLGIAIVVRPNLVLLFPLTWFLLWKYKVPKAFLRAAGQFAIAIAIYTAATAAVHGSPFLPQNGPYNLFAGANEYTEQVLWSSMNAEDSIIPALQDRGIVAEQHWDRQDNVPEHNDIRDAQYKKLYTHDAVAYLETHPLKIVELPALKFLTFLRPDLKAHTAKSAAGVAKILLALTFPAWVIACLLLPRPGQGVARIIVPLTLLTYIVPFVLTVSAPRFRVSLDVLCLIDIVAMLFTRYGWFEKAAVGWYAAGGTATD